MVMITKNDVFRKLTFMSSSFTAMRFDCSIRIQVVKSLLC